MANKKTASVLAENIGERLKQARLNRDLTQNKVVSLDGVARKTILNVEKGIELSPIKMPLSKHIFSFPELGFNTFKGLPGLIADSLAGDFGNAALSAWIACQDKSPSDITPLQRLQYTSKRDMGALEQAPATKLHSLNAFQYVKIQSLVSIAQEITMTTLKISPLFSKIIHGRSPPHTI